MAFKAVLFDLDNTLIDFEKFKNVCISASIESMRRAGLEMTKKEAKERIISIYKKSFFEDSRIFQKFLKEAYGKIDCRLLSAGIVAYRKARTSMMKTYPDVKKTLKKLRKMGLKLGIVTDAPRLKAWIRLNYIGIQDMFDSVLGFGDFKSKKPQKEPFKMAMEMLDVKPEETIFVGDNPKRDILGANKAGMTTVLSEYGLWGGLVLPKNPPKYEKPDHTIRSIKELIGIVKQGIE